MKRAVDMGWKAVVQSVKLLKAAQNSWERVPHSRTDSRNKPNRDWQASQFSREGGGRERWKVFSHWWTVKTAGKSI